MTLIAIRPEFRHHVLLGGGCLIGCCELCANSTDFGVLSFSDCSCKGSPPRVDWYSREAIKNTLGMPRELGFPIEFQGIPCPTLLLTKPRP